MVSGDSKRDRLRSVLRTTELGTAVSAARSLLDGDGASRQPLRGLYVQGVTATSAVICWLSERPEAGVVEYGKTPRTGTQGGRRPDWQAPRGCACRPRPRLNLLLLRGRRRPGDGERFPQRSVGENSGFSFAVVGDSGSGD